MAVGSQPERPSAAASCAAAAVLIAVWLVATPASGHASLSPGHASAVLASVQALRFASPSFAGACGGLDPGCARRKLAAWAPADGCSAGGSSSGWCNAVASQRRRSSMVWDLKATCPGCVESTPKLKEQIHASLYRNRRPYGKLHGGRDGVLYQNPADTNLAGFMLDVRERPIRIPAALPCRP
jgi:hypothetical protein